MRKLLNQEKFGQNLRRIRLSCGLTQEQTVAQLQVLGSPLSRSTYAIIEMGKGNIYISDLVGLQQIFQVDYAAFFEGVPVSR